jgi:hypothetical protein
MRFHRNRLFVFEVAFQCKPVLFVKLIAGHGCNNRAHENERNIKQPAQNKRMAFALKSRHKSSKTWKKQRMVDIQPIAILAKEPQNAHIPQMERPGMWHKSLKQYRSEQSTQNRIPRKRHGSGMEAEAADDKDAGKSHTGSQTNNTGNRLNRLHRTAAHPERCQSTIERPSMRVGSSA